MILRLIVVAGLVGGGLVAVTAPTAGAATITVSITTDTVDGGPNAAATAVEGVAVHAESELELDTVEIRNVLSPGGSIVWSSFGHGTTPYRMVVADSNLHHNTGTVLTCDNCSARITGTTISDNTGSGISMVDGYPLNCGQVSVDQTDVVGNGQTAIDALGGVALSLSQRDGVGASGVTIASSTIDGNRSTQAGGGLNVSPVLVEPGGLTAAISLDQTSVSGNESVGGGGGAWVGVGSLTSHQATFDGNQTTGDGGGMDLQAENVLLDQSTVDGSQATGTGGGARIDATSATLTNGTFDGNSAATGGSVAFLGSTNATLTYQTMADGTATTGAHIFAAPTAQVTGSRSGIVLRHGSTACGGPVTQAGFSVLADASCGSVATDEVTAADPQLAPLALSGMTRIRRPAPTSPLGGQVPVAD